MEKEFPEGFNPKSDYLITTFNVVKDENGDVIPNLRRNQETKIYSEEAYESGFVGVVNRRTKVQAKSMMELLGYRWEIVHKPKK